MARKNGERRMLFDTRGRRKHVIQVVYAILALLMGASLFLVVGPLNVTELFGGGSSSSAGQVLDEQAERIEKRLARRPGDEALLLSLARTRIAAGNAKLEVDSSTGARTVTPEARGEFERGLAAWSRYRKQAGSEPSGSAAQLVSSTYFSLAESSRSVEEAVDYVTKAARAQRIAAEQRPSIGSLSTLAIYEYFAGNFAAGDAAAAKAARQAPSKAEAKSVEKQLAEYRKRGKEFEKQKRQVRKEQRKKGREALENPFEGLGG